MRPALCPFVRQCRLCENLVSVLKYSHTDFFGLVEQEGADLGGATHWVRLSQMLNQTFVVRQIPTGNMGTIYVIIFILWWWWWWW